jgi:hypothetical protein
MGLFDIFKKKKETELIFNEVIKDTIYDLKNNSNACTLSGGETEEGKIIIPESVLGEKLKIFIRCFGESDLLDKEYLENEKLIHEKDINELTYKEIGTMLTAIIRGDRFCSGLIYSKVKDGTLLKLLERLKDIKSKEEE